MTTPADLDRRTVDPRQPVTWCGKRIDDMTREEAIAALKMAGRLLQRATASHASTLDAWKACRTARR